MPRKGSIVESTVVNLRKKNSYVYVFWEVQFTTSPILGLFQKTIFYRNRNYQSVRKTNLKKLLKRNHPPPSPTHTKKRKNRKKNKILFNLLPQFRWCLINCLSFYLTLNWGIKFLKFYRLLGICWLSELNSRSA